MRHPDAVYIIEEPKCPEQNNYNQGEGPQEDDLQLLQEAVVKH